MKSNILITDCENEFTKRLGSFLSPVKYTITESIHLSDFKKNKENISLLICPLTSYLNIKKQVNDSLPFPVLLLINNQKLEFPHPDDTIDIIQCNASEKEMEFRITNLLNFSKSKQELTLQNNKLKSYFDKNRKKTINLFGKHVDLKKAQKEIEIHNLRLEKAIHKNKFKTIELFGKHIDLKKAQKEIHEKNLKLEKVIEKNKQKTLELFGKHIDLKKAKREINDQKNHIEKQNHSITDSIKYASFIQSAVLTKDEKINEIIPRHFIIYMPRDIVSGDFYWAEKSDDTIYLVAADCTGHGVPGAFMSMLGISLLNEMILRHKNKPANKILELLRDKVIHSLNQTGKLDEAADGMDLSFCIINTKTLKMQFAGANNPIYIIRKSELIEIKGDRMPIGYSLRMKTSFTLHEFQLERTDRIFMFSDGFPDQFGGENGMKMRYKVFQQHILNSVHLSLDDQKKYLLDWFFEWKGSYIQIDDLLVIGFEI